MPVRLAASKPWDDIEFGEEQTLPLSCRELPEPRVENGRFPLPVTTWFRAQLEFAKGHDWIALPLAPQDTRIVMCADRDLGLQWDTQGDERRGAVFLGGKTIAVADRTTAHAARILQASHQVGLTGRFVKVLPRKRPERNEVQLLIVPTYFDMIKMLDKNKIDGFSMVEPFPTLAKFILGGERWKEETLGAAGAPELGGLCCVALVPAEVADKYPDAYKALLTALIASMCYLATTLGTDDLAPLLEKTLEVLSRGGSFKQFRTQAVALEAAAVSLDHFAGRWNPEQASLPQSLFPPELTHTVLYAEWTQLARHLRPSDHHKWRNGVERLLSPECRLYDLRLAREIGEHIVSTGLHKAKYGSRGR